jgi:threonine synthase
MLYESTRGGMDALLSADIMKQGIAKNGGLFVPETHVYFSPNEISRLVPMTYQKRAAFILKRFLTDFTPEEIDACTESAYAASKFSHPHIAPLKKLTESIYLLELWHGPTAAFKDMALQILPHLLVKSMQKTHEKREILILVATSGDTGKAALEGFKDVSGTKVLVFFPKDGVSQIQKLQMTTQEGKNVSSIGVDGNFDEAQSALKEIFSDEAFHQNLFQNGYLLSSANSINWGRLVPQIVYYFSAYADLIASGQIQIGEKLNFVVPTGNFGNILAGYYAKKMGLPVHKLICASNQNHILTDFIRTGQYDQNRPFYTSISPSMDILVSSNIERLLFDLTKKDASMVSAWMEGLKTQKKYRVTPEVLANISSIFWADFATEAQTRQTLLDIFTQHRYLMDTHTAVAMNVYQKYQNESQDPLKTVILSTASPFKFPQSVASGILEPDCLLQKSDFELLEYMSTKLDLPIPSGIMALKNKPIRHSGVCGIDAMRDKVMQMV